MPRRIKQILQYSLLCWLCFILFVVPVLAVDNLQFTPAVSIPGTEFVAGQATEVQQDTSTICDYLIGLYKYLIGTIAIFAAVALIIGGVIWITSAGSPGRIGIAKSWIASSLTGLALALGAFLLLATINPELVICRYISIDSIKNITISQSKQPSNNKKQEACKWDSSSNATTAKCDAGFIKKDNSYCAGLPYNADPFGVMPASYPKPDWKGYYCCCADKSKLDAKNYCQNKSEGATCRVNNAWGYCEEVKGTNICRPCKERLKGWVKDGATPKDTETEAQKLNDKFKCYRSSKEWECADDSDICGNLANIDEQDCNSNSPIGFTVMCWKINSAHLGDGTVADIFAQCRCQ